MKVYHYSLPDSQEDIIIIAPIQDEEEYLVVWEGEELGYIYPILNNDTFFIDWKGSNPILNLLAKQLGIFIEDSGL
ncbi:hypothetical protein [Pedobacter hartonius]|uniref:Uncharacterized protein n=1 Tax=Pedobacter hartonius TaxID=425514 RepID=A0A1H3W5A0_9SPHI|nr:hypothetical protein [Pedobacter hartonius]SDZ82247.1 hypothetical protein SAMN05443550_101104 [Pedobacter hartonius]